MFVRGRTVRFDQFESKTHGYSFRVNKFIRLSHYSRLIIKPPHWVFAGVTASRLIRPSSLAKVCNLHIFRILNHHFKASSPLMPLWVRQAKTKKLMWILMGFCSREPIPPKGITWHYCLCLFTYFCRLIASEFWPAVEQAWSKGIHKYKAETFARRSKTKKLFFGLYVKFGYSNLESLKARKVVSWKLDSSVGLRPVVLAVEQVLAWSG